MKTSDIRRAIRLCKGSLMSMDLVPILTHFCFDGDSVYAFNDITAVVATLETGVSVGVRGEVLLGVLDTLGENVTLAQKKGNILTMKSGKTEVNLITLPKKDFLLSLPDEKVLVKIKVDAALIQGLSLCRATVSENALAREYTGVAVMQDAEEFCIYSTDDTRLSRFRISSKSVTKVPSKSEHKFLIPAQSVRQILEVWNTRTEEEEGGKVEGVFLEFTKNWCWMSLDGATLFSKLMPETPPDYAAMFAKVFTMEKSMTSEVPEGFVEALRRAEVLTSRDTQPAVSVEVSSKDLTVSVKKATLGTFEDSFKVASKTDVSLRMVPAKLREAADGAEKMAFSDRCIAFKKGAFTCLVSPLAPEQDEKDEE